MATKKRKTRVNPVMPNTCAPLEYRPSPKQQVEDLQRQLQHAESRTDIETVAMNAAGLVEAITEHRRAIASYENELRDRREHLSAALLQHQLTVVKFKELAAVPQPTA